MARSDARRIALLVVMIGAAVGFAWASAEDGLDDVLRFTAGAGAGLILGGLTRLGDGRIAAAVPFDRRIAITHTAVIVVSMLVPAALLLARDVSLAAGLEVMLAGAAAGFFAAVGVLYPLP